MNRCGELWAFTAIMASTSVPALAEDAPKGTVGSTQASPATDEDKPIVVTARRREERIGDVPAAVDVLGQQAIADRGGLITLQDVAANVPSVNFANTSTPSTAEVSIRGSGTARATNAEGGVGLYRNGTFVGGGRLGGRTFTRMDFFDLDRIEVLRGVQSALYGRNAVGGAINLINVEPQFRDGGYFRIGYGSYNRAEAQGALNLQLSETLAIRVGADLLEQGQGAFYNPYRKDYFDEQRARGVRGQLRFKSGIVDANILVEDSYAKLPPLIFSVQIAPGAVAFPQGVSQDPYNIGWNGRSVAEQRQRAVIARLRMDLGFADWSTSGSIRQRDTDHGFDADGLDPDFLFKLRQNGGGLTTDAFQESLQRDQTKSFYVETHLSGSFQNNFNWLLGYENVTLRSSSQFSTTRTPTPANRSIGALVLTQLNTFGNAVFGSLGYEFGRVSLTGEARYTSEKKTLDTDRVDLGTLISQGPRFAINTADTEDNISYTATASLRLPAINGLAYLRYATGFRAGGFNNDLGDPRGPIPVPPTFDNEAARSIELGAKGSLAPGLNFALAAYEVNTSKVLVQDVNGCGINVPACPTTSTVFIRNGGDARVRGGEAQLDANFKLGETRITLNASAAYIDAVVRRGIDAGRTIPQVPNWLFNIGANLTVPIGTVVAFGNMQYNSRIGGVQEIIQTPDLVDFYNANVRIGVRFSGVEIAAFADNATDKRYVIFSSASVQRRNYPRSFGVQLTKRW